LTIFLWFAIYELILHLNNWMARLERNYCVKIVT
jgi:hypothetical protein